MADFRYGPVELYLVGFDGENPSPDALQALLRQVDTGLVRLLDLVILRRSESGELTVTEIEDVGERFGLGDVEFGAAGITGTEDIEDLASLVEPGRSAAVVALELTYARELASTLAASGGVVLSTERIPAPVVNALMDAIDHEGE